MACDNTTLEFCQSIDAVLKTCISSSKIDVYCIVTSNYNPPKRYNKFETLKVQEYTTLFSYVASLGPNGIFVFTIMKIFNFCRNPLSCCILYDRYTIYFRQEEHGDTFVIYLVNKAMVISRCPDAVKTVLAESNSTMFSRTDRFPFRYLFGQR